MRGIIGFYGKETPLRMVRRHLIELLFTRSLGTCTGNHVLGSIKRLSLF